MADRFFGIALLIMGSLGYLCIAEDPRHLYEIMGVSAVFVAGAVLTVSGFHWLAVRPVMARSVAAGLIVGIVVGVLMRDIPNGVGLGLVVGAMVGAVIVRFRRRSNPPSDGTTTSPGPRA